MKLPVFMIALVLSFNLYAEKAIDETYEKKYYIVVDESSPEQVVVTFYNSTDNKEVGTRTIYSVEKYSELESCKDGSVSMCPDIKSENKGTVPNGRFAVYESKEKKSLLGVIEYFNGKPVERLHYVKGVDPDVPLPFSDSRIKKYVQIYKNELTESVSYYDADDNLLVSTKFNCDVTPDVAELKRFKNGKLSSFFLVYENGEKRGFQTGEDGKREYLYSKIENYSAVNLYTHHSKDSKGRVVQESPHKKVVVKYEFKDGQCVITQIKEGLYGSFRGSGNIYQKTITDVLKDTEETFFYSSYGYIKSAQTTNGLSTSKGKVVYYEPQADSIYYGTDNKIAKKISFMKDGSRNVYEYDRDKKITKITELDKFGKIISEKIEKKIDEQGW